MKFIDICSMCSVCKLFYANSDTDVKCRGKGEPCHEFILCEKFAFLDKVQDNG